MVVKKTISLKKSVFDMAEEKSNKLFSDNFSSYIAYLICKDNQQPENTMTIKNDRNNSIVDEIKDIMEGL